MSAQTARLAETPSPWGSPSGPGLWHHKSWKLPNYVEQVSKGIMKSGRAHSESEAIQMALGVLGRWARGGGKVSPEVQAAAAKALAEFAALKAAAAAHAHANDAGANDAGAAVDLSYVAPHVPAGSPNGGQFGTTSSGGKGTPAQQHAAHDAHMAHLQHLVATGKATPAQRAELARLTAGKPAGFLSSPAWKATLAALKASTPAKAPAVKKATVKKPKTNKIVVHKKKGTVTATVNGKRVTMRLHEWHVIHKAHQQAVAREKALKAGVKFASDGDRFLELAFTEALAERVPPGRREGGRFAPPPEQLSRYDTPEQAAKVINALESAQRAMVRASTLPPPGFSWTDADRLTIAE